MTRFNTLLLVVILSGGAGFSRSAVAQSTYTPQRPTVSPWLGLWQNNSGALDNYHTFVRPQMELNNTLQMQNAALRRQEVGLQNLNNEAVQPLGTATGMLPTGQGATFMSYSHYYGGNNRPTSRPMAPRPTASKATANIPTVPTASNSH